MRVLFVAHAFPRARDDLAGGFLLGLARALVARGVAVHVVAPASRDAPATHDFDGVTVERVRYAPRAWETIAYTGAMADAVTSWPGRIALGGLVASTARAVRRAARAHRADVVHAHWWFPGGLAAAAAASIRGAPPLVLTLHGSDVRLALGVRAARGLFAHVTARAAATTAVSSWLCARAREMAPALECEVAPMPVDHRLFAPPPAGAGREGLLFVGRLTAQKGVDVLLRALAQAPHGETLTVIGDGPEGGALRGLAESLGLSPRVRWLGALAPPDVARYCARAKALVVPSRDEGLGLVAVEAQLCGTPVVAADSGGLPDVVRHDVTGVLVPPDRPEALSAALRDLLGDPARAARLGAAGRLAAAAGFGPAGVAARYHAIYARAAAR